MWKIDISRANEHPVRHIFIWTVVVKHQTKGKIMLNDVFVLF